jgi:hypothetical protein
VTAPADARRRWFGVLFLLLGGGMLVWGLTVLRPHLVGLGFVAYWLVCLVLTGLAMVVALLDARATRLRIREQHHELLRRTIGNLASEQEDTPRPKR